MAADCAGVQVDKPISDGAVAETSRKKAKKSTQKGEGREKLIGALTKHHKFAEGCLNWEPIGNNELARMAGVEESSASEFFKKYFDGHGNYKILCVRNHEKVLVVLKSLNDDYSVDDLYGATPPGDREREGK